MTRIDRSANLVGNTGMKAPVRLATTANIVLSGLQIIDGVAAVAGDRVLVKNQTSGIDNGIYVADTGDWNRDADCDGPNDLVQGSLVRVVAGVTNADSYWALSTSGTITPGVTSLSFVISSSALVGVSALMQTVLAATTQSAAAGLLDVPLNAAAVLHTLADAKGDLILASAADAFVRKGAPADGSVLIAAAAQTGGWTFSPHTLHGYAPNPYFQIDQRVNSATARADDTYCLDRWYVLTQTGTVAVSQQSDTEDGQPFNIRLSQSQAVAQRMGIACIIEGRDARGLRGKSMFLVPRIRCSNSQPIRVAVVEWTGTEDAVTSDVVLDWTSSTYTPGNFFVAANFALQSAPLANTPSANVWTDMDGWFGSVGSTAKNLILFVWTEGTAAQNVTLDVGKIRFVEGTYAGPIAIPNWADELARSERYYEKSFPYQTVPAQGIGNFSGAESYYVTNAGVVLHGHYVPYKTKKRAAATLTFFNPTSANANWRNQSDPADSAAAGGGVNTSDRGFVITNAQVAGDGVGEQLVVHWTADAEL